MAFVLNSVSKSAVGGGRGCASEVALGLGLRGAELVVVAKKNRLK